MYTGLPKPLISSKELVVKAQKAINSCVHIEQLEVAYAFYMKVLLRFDYTSEEKLWASHIIEWETEMWADGRL